VTVHNELMQGTRWNPSAGQAAGRSAVGMPTCRLTPVTRANRPRKGTDHGAKPTQRRIVQRIMNGHVDRLAGMHHQD